ncbi:hypothetical protein [Mesorhizobium sp. WSM2239]|uniref:Response regulatory domain-containing protein n=2 Tax=unclassified Mesorhizobium TaxID=325217 RepID=A0AAU8D803_9HYPH
MLLIEDKALGSAVREHVAAGGHAVDWAKSLSEARDYAAGAVAAYELVLLKLNLPDGNDIDYLREMRKWQNGDSGHHPDGPLSDLEWHRGAQRRFRR